MYMRTRWMVLLIITYEDHDFFGSFSGQPFCATQSHNVFFENFEACVALPIRKAPIHICAIIHSRDFMEAETLLKKYIAGLSGT